VYDKEGAVKVRDLLDGVVRGTREVLRSPALAGAIYAGALVAVLVTRGFRRRD
jgi:hypothetical protein